MTLSAVGREGGELNTDSRILQLRYSMMYKMLKTIVLSSNCLIASQLSI